MNDFAKYRSPASLIAFGLLIVVFALSSGQGPLFLLGGVTIMIAGVIALLSAMNKVNRTMQMVLTVVLLGMVGLLGFQNFRVIKEPLDFMAERDARYEVIEQRLKDIRQLQISYKKTRGFYCQSLDSLIYFVNNDSIIEVKATGEVPDSLTEFQALQQKIITRDTFLTPAMEVVFNSKYMETRDVRYQLVVDSLPYVPFAGGAKFILNAGEIDRGNAMVPVFEAMDSKPFDPEYVLKVGSMTEPSVSGNWE